MRLTCQRAFARVFARMQSPGTSGRQGSGASSYAAASRVSVRISLIQSRANPGGDARCVARILRSSVGAIIGSMSIDELQVEALKLGAEARARLAQRLLESLEDLSDEENAKLWAEEAERRADAWDAAGEVGRPADEVFRHARARIG